MDKINLDVIEFKKWNRRILNIYWLIAVIAAITEIAIFFTAKNQISDLEYLKRYLMLPGLLNIGLLTITEVLYTLTKNKYKEITKYLIIISGTLLVCIMVYVHYQVAVIYVLFILPIFLSVFYGNKKITSFAIGLNLICYLVVFFLYLPTKADGTYIHSFKEFYTMIGIIFSIGLLVFACIDRVVEIIESLIKEQQSQQELAVKNFVMEFNSKIEPTTGLYNHKTFYEYLGFLIKQSDNFVFPLSLAVLDIDNFKRINDIYGHSFGDKAISDLVEIIKGSISSDDFAARYGGDEFAIIFTDKSKEDAFEIVENIRIKFRAVIINDMGNEKLGISIGISEHIRGNSMQIFFDNTDNALYKAKGSGKNQTVMYNKEAVSK